MGYDPGDEDLSGDDIKGKYQGNILETKSLHFKGLKIKEQQDILYSALTNEKTDTVRRSEDSATTAFILRSVTFFLLELKKIEKFDEWTKRTIPYKEFFKLPLEEKRKYYNILVAFHDECMKERRSSSGSEVLDSSPTPSEGDRLNFDDKKIWQEVD